MVPREPNYFADIITMGMRLEEGVREGHLVKESTPIYSSEENDQEVSMMKGWPQQQYQAYHPVAAVMPNANDVRNSSYQP